MKNADGHILVTGGAGYIGSHTTLALHDAGWDVVVVDDLSAGHRALIPADIPHVVGDAGDPEVLRRIFDTYNVSGVMHFAGSITLAESLTDPLKYYANNTGTSRRLLDACQANGVRSFVFSSSAAVYGNPSDIPVHEDAALLPISPYGASKMMTERMLIDLAALGGMNFAILRYFNVAGADPQCRSGQVSPQVTHLIRIAAEVVTGRRNEICIYGTDYATPDGTCIRDYVHVSDVADAHLEAFSHISASRESIVLNCGYGHGYSVREVLAAVERVTGEDLAIREAQRRIGDAGQLVAATDRIHQVLGWSPRFNDLDNIIQSALDWERRKIALGID